MTSQELDALIALQQKDLTLLQLKKEAKGIPERQETLRRGADSARTALELSKARLQSAQAAVRELELEAESLRAQEVKYKSQQMQVRTNEEYKALEHEIAAALQKFTQLEDQELIRMGEVEELQAGLRQAESDLVKAKTKAESEVAALESRLGVIRETFEEVRREREVLAAGLDPEIATTYLNLLAKKQDAVVVPIRGDCCGGCHMKLTPQTLHDANSRQKWTYCSYCGRLLYQS